jgi:DNA polymerase-3 subunit beta
VSSCINPLEQNQTLTGVLIDSTRQSSTIEATGTDGLHLIYIKEKYDGEKNKIIINNETIKQLNFLINQSTGVQNIFFFLHNNQLMVQINNSLLLCRLLEGTYPSAIKTIEGHNELNFTINKNEITNAIERGMIVASGDKKPSITLNIQHGKLKLTCRSVECGASYEELNIDGNIKETITISLNAKLLLDLIKNIDTNKVLFEFTSNNKPIIIKNENDANYVSLILPIRNI